MPSTTSTVVSNALPSSTVITPSVPTFSKASASFSPIDLSLLAAIAATSAISFLPETFLDCDLTCSTTASTALSMPRFECHRVGAGGQGLEPFLVDRLGQHGRGGGAVAGGVGGLGGRFLDELGTHVLVGVGQLDFLGHRHAVLGDGRAAPALVDHGITAARAERGTNGPRQFRSRRWPASGGPPHRRPISSPRWFSFVMIPGVARVSPTRPNGGLPVTSTFQGSPVFFFEMTV